MKPGIARHFTSDRIRYAQCWEDADVLLQGLAAGPGDVCLSIASAGDNTLSLLTQDPARVVAVDLSRAQLACLELRIAAYRALAHPELLELIGSTPSTRRLELYRRCRSLMPVAARNFWDERPRRVTAGVGAAGVLENYLRIFRRFVLPLIHPPGRVAQLLAGGTPAERRAFYERYWNTRRWRLMFRIFFSRALIGGFGHGPDFFGAVSDSVAERLLARCRHTLTELDPTSDPYLHWSLRGRHLTALPHALRPENFSLIRQRLDRLECRHGSFEQALEDLGPRAVHRFNLSNILEYMPREECQRVLSRIAWAGVPGGRLLYWDMLTPRSAAGEIPGLRRRDDLAGELHRASRTCFYDALVIEDIVT